jgi:hypothetical protein
VIESSRASLTSAASTARSHSPLSEYSQARNPTDYPPGQQEPSSNYDFSNGNSITLQREMNGDLETTCISASGETVALVGKNEFEVYKLSDDHQSLVTPKYSGHFDESGDFRSGRPATSQGRIMNDNKKRDFECAAISDNLLVIGASKSGCLLFFSVADGDQCRCIFKHEHNNRTIRKLFFNADGTELAVLSGLPEFKKEICEIYSVGSFPMNMINTSRTHAVPDLNCRPDCNLELDMTYTSPEGTYRYIPRDAKFSFDSRKIVICTGHSRGTALVFILAKGRQNSWQWKRQRFSMPLDPKDMARLGFTGVSLYGPVWLKFKVAVVESGHTTIRLCFLSICQ